MNSNELPSHRPVDARELELLEALAEEPEVRQVDLATRLGVAVGTVNWLIKRLATKGWIKIRRIGRWRWSYIITPKGLAEKTRLTQQYLNYSMRMYRQARQDARKILEEVKRRGYEAVLIDESRGSDLADVYRLTCLEQKVVILEEKDRLNVVPILRIEGRRAYVRWPQDADERESSSDRTRSSTWT